jgi:hypothetical protein
VRLGDDERVLHAVGAGHERAAGHPGVVAGARRLEIRQVDSVVDVPERVGVDEAHLDRVFVQEVAYRRVSAAGHAADHRS